MSEENKYNEKLQDRMNSEGFAESKTKRTIEESLEDLRKSGVKVTINGKIEPSEETDGSLNKNNK